MILVYELVAVSIAIKISGILSLNILKNILLFAYLLEFGNELEFSDRIFKIGFS